MNSMLSKWLFIIVLVSNISIGFSQDYYIPLNIQRAYENQTRNLNGNPGEKYWQNNADYKIEAELNTATDEIFGKAVISYHNNSPDSLHQMVFRLYPDYFKTGNARQYPAAKGDLMDGVNITKLIINGQTYDPDKSGYWWQMTNLSIPLQESIPPGKSVEIETEWNFQLPVERGLRMRKYSEGHYFIAYWYPQIAVYDDIDGWDEIEYLGSVEFYNDINNFDVNISLPGDYLMWATGNLINADELLEPEILERYNNAKLSDSVIRIVSQADYNDNKINGNNKTNIWHFIAKNVPDFSFAASTHSNWDGCSLIVDSLSRRRVLTDVVYPDGADHWDKAAEVSRSSVQYMSFQLPGVAFPYPKVTSFCNGTRRGGMETPMMANNGMSAKFSSIVGLLFHEISHNYFPFYMGTNERKYAFMDEGWAALLPGDIIEKYSPGYDYFTRQVNSYLSLAGKDIELPLMIPSFQHNSWSSARIAAYTRPAVAYQMLRETLGEEVFKKALKTYMNRWAGKHPGPFDFFYTFEDVCGEDLYWFFEPWFFQQGYPDLAIEELTTTNELLIRKKGQFPIPIDINWWTEDGKSHNKYISPTVWKDGKKEISIQLSTDSMITKIVLGNSHIPDVNKADNIFIPK